MWFQDLQGEEAWGWDVSSCLKKKRWEGGWWPDPAAIQTWRPWQRVRFDPESDGEITEGFQVREENDAI